MNKVQYVLSIVVGFSIYNSVYSIGALTKTQSRAFSRYAGNTVQSWFTRWLGQARKLEKIPFSSADLERKAIEYEKRAIENDIAMLNKQLSTLHHDQNKLLAPTQYWKSPKILTRVYEYFNPERKLQMKLFSPDALTIKSKIMEVNAARNALLNRLKILEKGYRVTR
ncbi:MAG TPA: hypothetical protein VGW78_06230 [Candidatus Babeliales bacterium]|nr:hypothetical protein [Candidatus Babeliales bacterium]